jgi:hypothetical protein
LRRLIEEGTCLRAGGESLGGQELRGSEGG